METLMLYIGKWNWNIKICSIHHAPSLGLPELTAVIHLFVLHTKDIPHSSSDDLKCSEEEITNIFIHPLLLL